MDLTVYGMHDLLLAAMKAESEAAGTYVRLAGAVRNPFLKDRLLFLGKEEGRHHQLLERIWERHFPGQPVRLPDRTPVPLPGVGEPGADFSIVELLGQAMAAEAAAADFYHAAAERFRTDLEVRRTLDYLASMETGHLRVLELEREQAAAFESKDEEPPVLLVGP